jgi:putative DNA primase/helicase
LTPESSFDEINVAVHAFAMELASLPPVEKRLLLRHQGISILRTTRISTAAALIDAALAEVKDSAAGDLEEGEAPRMGPFADVEPWLDPVNGQDLLTELESFIRTYVVLADMHAYAPFALWALAAHAHNCFPISPILVLSSPTKRSGKTTALMVLSALVPKPMFTSNTTAAALFHAIDAFHPTVIIDEGDTFINGDEALRGLLNSGHIRDLARIMRKAGWYSTWAPKVIAVIDRVPETVEDRSITILMVRRAASEKVEQLRSDRLHEHEHLRRKMARWVQDHAEEIKAADPEIPSEITSDRARDNWRVLIAIADVIGGEWPHRVREAAIQLSKSDEEFEDDLDATLLRDLQTIFLQQQAERLERQNIVRRLVAMEDHPWVDYSRGRALTVRDLGKILRRFRIKPQKWAVQEASGRAWQRGYYLSELADVFARYAPIPAPPQAREVAPQEQPHVPQVPQRQPPNNPTPSPRPMPELTLASPTPRPEPKWKRLLLARKPKAEQPQTPPKPPRTPGRRHLIPGQPKKTT